MAHYSGRRSKIADEILRLNEQQREFVQNASVMGKRKGDSRYAERAKRIAQLLTELVASEETYSVQATERNRPNSAPWRIVIVLLIVREEI